MDDEYDFSKAQRGRTRDLPPIDELARHTKVTNTTVVEGDELPAFRAEPQTAGVVLAVTGSSNVESAEHAREVGISGPGSRGSGEQP